MVKEFFITILFFITIASGLVAVLALLGWLWGAKETQVILVVSGLVFVPCSVIVSLMKDGWKRLLAEVIIPF